MLGDLCEKINYGFSTTVTIAIYGPLNTIHSIKQALFRNTKYSFLVGCTALGINYLLEHYAPKYITARKVTAWIGKVAMLTTVCLVVAEFYGH